MKSQTGNNTTVRVKKILHEDSGTRNVLETVTVKAKPTVTFTTGVPRNNGPLDDPLQLIPQEVLHLLFSFVPELTTKLVCYAWYQLFQSRPQTGADIIKLFPKASDGEYTLYGGKGRNIPFTAYIHDIIGKPEEYLSLKHTGENYNYSEFPYQNSKVRTQFSKLRIDPMTFLIKTDDYRFSISKGSVTQIYWNGKAELIVNDVPFATARSCGGSGDANIDLTGTPFIVKSKFEKMGCSPFGTLTPLDSVGQCYSLTGGGYAGRLCPEKDVTVNEKSEGGDYDNEGRNGGWVLELQHFLQ